MRKATTPDGTKVMVSPHAPDGHPDYGNEYYQRDRGLQRRVHAYQDQIMKIIDDNDLWQYIDEPGRMAAEYRAIRKADPEMPQLVQCVKASVRGLLPERNTPEYLDEVPEEWREWPFPGMVRKKQGVENSDWIVDKEMKSVFVFILENVNKNPLDPNNKKEFNQVVKMSDVEQARFVKGLTAKMFRGGQRRHKIIIPAGCAMRFTLLDDAELPRTHPKLRLVRYNHADPAHNTELKSDGSYDDMRAYVEAAAPVVVPTKKVMEDAEG